MSELRKHLDTARGEYRKARYPGDLSAELINHPHPPVPWLWILIPAGIAAAILAGVWLFGVVSETNPILTEQTAQAEVEEPTTLAIPAMRQFDVDSPSVWSFSAPSFSFLENEVPEENTATTKESV